MIRSEIQKEHPDVNSICEKFCEYFKIKFAVFDGY